MVGTTRAERMAAALEATFAGAEVAVRDDSASHAGHMGASPAGETHYAVRVVWDGFSGQNLVARQRAVNAALAGEFGAGLHALSIQARAPGEG